MKTVTRRGFVGGVAVLPALHFSAAYAQAGVSAAEARAIAKEAYIYGFPIVDNYRIQHAYWVDKTTPEYKGPWNQMLSQVCPLLPHLALVWPRPVPSAGSAISSTPRTAASVSSRPRWRSCSWCRGRITPRSISPSRRLRTTWSSRARPTVLRGFIVSQANYIYPIAGRIGVDKSVRTFLELTYFGNLASDKANPGASNVPNMADNRACDHA